MTPDEEARVIIHGSALSTAYAARLAADLAEDASLARAALRWSSVTGMSYEAAHGSLSRSRDAMRDAMRNAAKLVGDLAEALRPILPEKPPTDPRARALWARQHRNTGPPRQPAGQQHRPRKHT